MNTRQLIAMWVGICAAGALFLFPPHAMMPNLMGLLQTEMGGPATKPVQLVRYAFIFSPPAGSAGIDWERFWLPVVPVALATFGALVTLKGHSTRATPATEPLEAAV